MQGNLIDEAETESLFHEIRTKFITLYLVGCGDSTHRCRRRRHEVFARFVLLTAVEDFARLPLKPV